MENLTLSFFIFLSSKFRIIQIAILFHLFSAKAMEQKGKDDQPFGICHRLFNFIRKGSKWLTLGHIMTQGSTGKGSLGEFASNEVQEPLASQAKDDGSDPTVKILFKQTEELDDQPTVDKFGLSVPDPSGKKENSLRTGIGHPKIIVPVASGEAGNEFAMAKPTTPVRPDDSRLVLTGLGLNINEISDKYIKKTKERMIKNVNLMKPEKS
ncbi:hypothetical protein ES319_A08G195900v1 [Gossypium barbadense]|uniref:Uncharacterized protein n=3 Tax=Gossypium TaxID=3633 RepID=A0A5J5UUB3_GOSBA|nr:hypothetical protein ES319_A08G195900v1 [Gossypium barbadense]TYI15867.1 hypothetical protein ES332_A08G216500v1 [Gossypium tomentosum]